MARAAHHVVEQLLLCGGLICRGDSRLERRRTQRRARLVHGSAGPAQERRGYQEAAGFVRGADSA